MIQAVLVCISLAFLSVGGFLYRRNIELFLCLLILIYSDFFHVLPSFHGPDDYKLLLVPAILVLFFESLITGKLSMGRYGWWVISFMGISVFGVFVSWHFGQGISLGIKAAKFVPLVLVYFILAGRPIKTDKFTNYFILLGLAAAVMAIITYLTHGTVNIFRGLPLEQMLNEAGGMRVRVGQFVISAAAVAAFARYSRSSQKRYLMAAAILLCEVVVVQQTRGFIVSIVLGIFIVTILSHPLTSLRLSLYLMLAGLGIIAWMVFSSMDLSGIGLVKKTQTDFSKRGSSYGGSLQARINAYDYYWNQMKLHPITGRGVLNFNWKGNTEKYMQQYHGIHLSDIGITQFLVQAGTIGIIWLLYGLYRIWRDILIYRRHIITVACYFIIGTFAMPTLDMFLRFDTIFIFAVFLGISSGMIRAARNGAVSEGL